MNTLMHPAPKEVMALLDGELTSAEASAVSEHIEQCAECAAVRAQFRSTSQLLCAWIVPEAPVELDHAMQARVEGALRTGKSPRLHTPLTLRNWRVWAIAGGSAMLGALALSVFSPMSFQREHAQSDQRVLAYLRPDSPPAPAPQPAAVAGIAGYTDTDSLSPSARARSEAINGPLEDKIPHLAGGGGGGLVSGSTSASGAPMIARSVSLTILVKNVAIARTALDSILAQHHGYAAQLTLNTPESGARSFQSSLRIPAPELQEALDGLRALGRVQTETQAGEEVTQQHTDLVARLTNARETETRLRDILLHRTGKMEDVLDVEEKISKKRGEIEQMEAEVKALEHRVDFASIDLTLTEEYKAQFSGPSTSVDTRLHNAFIHGLRTAGDSILGFILFLEESGPVLLVWALILGVPGWLLWRRYRRSRAAIG